MKIKVKELNPGDRFGYGMKSAIVLDKMDDGFFAWWWMRITRVSLTEIITTTLQNQHYEQNSMFII